MAGSKAFMRFGAQIKEFRLHLCPKALESKGVRDFMDHEYVKLKKMNPKTPFLVRECRDIQPKIWARYAFGRERSLSLENYSKEQITETIENLAQKID